MSERDASPLNVMSAFCAAQLRDNSENKETTRVELNGMLNMFASLASRREIAVPIVTLLEAPAMLVVVQPVESLFVHVLPVKPLMQTQLQVRSELKIEIPPFWHVMTPSHWLLPLPGASVGIGELVIESLLSLLLLLPLFI